MKSLLLDSIAWDLTLDISGNIAVATDPYSLAQDAACAIKLFQGELWYDTTKGVPWWATTLGKAPPLSLIRAKLVQAAMTVPGVVAVRVFISSYSDRRVTGQVQIFDAAGQRAVAAF